MARAEGAARQQRPRSNRPRPEEAAAYFDKQPPFDLQAELGVLGSIVLMPEALDDISPILRAEDFYGSAHQTWYRHMTALHESNRRFDHVLLMDRLRSAEEFEMAGGAAYLAKIINAVPNAAHARYYAEIVREKAIYRRLIFECTTVLKDAYDTACPAVDMVAQAETAIARVSDTTIIGEETRSLNDVVIQAIDDLERRMTSTSPRVLDVGLHALRDCMGLVPGGVTIIGGRTSMGKSALLIAMARHAARHGSRVYFCTLEMTAMEVVDRILSVEAQVDCRRMMQGRISPDERARIVEHASYLSNWPIHFDDRPSMSLSQIAASCRKLKRRHSRLDMVVVDYLQIVEPEDRKDDRLEQLAKITRGLKRMARELQVPVVCAAQVNRGSEENADKRPRLYQLRGAGDIEQDADSVVFVHRPAYYVHDPTPTPHGQAEDAEINLAKNRNGPTGTCEVLWFKEYMSWQNKASARHEHEADPDRQF